MKAFTFGQMQLANERAAETGDFEPLLHFAEALYERGGFYAATDHVWACHRPYVEGRLDIQP